MLGAVSLDGVLLGFLEFDDVGRGHVFLDIDLPEDFGLLDFIKGHVFDFVGGVGGDMM